MTPHPKQLLAGILEPVFAIRTENDLGIGDTEGVRQMIDWCHAHKLNIFQTLPINETGDDNSPYDAISSLALEPATIHISPRAIPDLSTGAFQRMAGSKRLKSLRQGPVNYSKVKELKRELLEAAFDVFLKRHFESATPRAREFRKFQQQQASWLPDYALFRMLMEENGGSPAWDHWPDVHKSPEQARAWLVTFPPKKRARLINRQLFFMYVQWLAFSQWQALKSYGDKKNVFLMGDIPYGVARHSADVWANRTLFDLDWCGGAPPEKCFKVDKFTEKWGQNWGIANYRWDEMRRRNFHWWRTRVGNLRTIFRFCRIDHGPGFFRIYSFPWTPDQNAKFVDLTRKEALALTGGKAPGFRPHADDTAEHKKANQRHGEELLRMVQEAAGDMVIIVEDLGVVPDYMRPTMRKIGMPGFCIPTFDRQPGGSFADPSSYSRLSVAQPATHDHPTLAATWAEHWGNIDAGVEVRHNRAELRHWMTFADLHEMDTPREFNAELYNAYFGTLFHSNSWLVVVMITDVFGMQIRFNTPGSRSDANWSERLPWTVKQMLEDTRLSEKSRNFSRLAQVAGRGY